MIEMPLILITGYRGTGKDTFVNPDPEVKLLPWKILTKNLKWTQFPYTDLKRIAFADYLKESVKEKYPHLKEFSLDELELIKDSPLGVSGLSFRDLCIQEASLRLSEDKYFYVRKVWEKIKDSYQTQNYAVTDFRYPAELEFLKEKVPNLVTIRLFRSEVTIPGKDIPSEHANDYLITDYIGVLSNQDAQEFLSLFPQYKS